MKKLALLLAIAFVALPSFAQKCEYARNENDPFLKIRKVETKETIIWNWKKRLTFSLARYGDNKFLIANVTLFENALFSSGDKMILLFEDKSTLEFDLFAENGNSVSFGERMNYAGVDYYTYRLMYQLPTTAVLEGKKLAGVRIYNSSSFFEYQVGRTGLELGGAGKDKKLARIERLFSKENLDCINI